MIDIYSNYIDLPKLISIISEGYSLLSPRRVTIRSNSDRLNDNISDIPQCHTVELPGALEYVIKTSLSISSKNI